MNTINLKALSEEVQKLETKVKNLDIEIPSHGVGDAGKYLGVDSSGDLEFSNPPGKYKLDYSENETSTGLKWIDGKKIYSRSFEGTTPESTGTFLVGTLGPINTLIHMFGSCSETTHPERLRLLERMYAPAIVIATGEITLSISEGYTSSYYNLTVLYTKPDPEPSQETLTKKRKTTK